MRPANNRSIFRRLLSAIVDQLVLAYVRWAIRDEPLGRKDLLGSRLISILQAELDHRGEEAAAFEAKLKASERAAVIETIFRQEPPARDSAFLQ